MAVRIVEDVPGGTGMRRLWRGIVVLLGVLLVIVGLLSAILPVLYLVGTALLLVTGDEVSALSAKDAQELALFCVVAIAGLWIGLRLIRGRRRLGLYLRKFGFAEATQTVSRALASAVGRSLRLVTLDDSMVAPIGAGSGRRRIAGLAWFAGAVLVAWMLYYILGGSLERDSEDAITDTMANAAAQAGDDIGEAFSAALGGAIAGALFSAFIFIAAAFVVSFAIVVGLLGRGSYLAARRAERSATRTLTSERSVDSVAKDIAASGKRIFAARLVVIAVPTQFWQRAVHALARAANVVIIDVSQPTDNLIWEVQNIKPMFNGRWVLVGARDAVAPLALPQTQTAATPQGLLARMLDGEEIIAYGPLPSDKRRFARALRRRLEQLSRRH